MSTLKVDTITDSSSGLTTTINGVTPSTHTVKGRNLVINGAMTVAQRGTSATGVTAPDYYTVDRFAYNHSGADQLAFTMSQASDAPDGFTKSLKMETTTAETTVDSTEYYMVRYKVEAQDLQHLKHGTSEAKQLTLSFWAKSSIAATYALYLYKPNIGRIIGSTYTINSVNTWEYKTITFAGDTGGGINDGNIEGLHLTFVLGAGSDMITTDNTSWSAYSTGNLAYGHTANSVVTTVGATWQITGVQLELGSVDTEFDYRSYGEELQLCQRYYEKFGQGWWSRFESGSGLVVNGQFKVEKRTAPTIGLPTGGTIRLYEWGVGDRDATPTLTSTSMNANGGHFKLSGFSGGSTGEIWGVGGTNTDFSTHPFEAKAEL